MMCERAARLNSTVVALVFNAIDTMGKINAAGPCPRRQGIEGECQCRRQILNLSTTSMALGQLFTLSTTLMSLRSAGPKQKYAGGVLGAMDVCPGWYNLRAASECQETAGIMFMRLRRASLKFDYLGPCLHTHVDQ